MTTTYRWSRVLPGVAVALLSATALAAVGDLKHVNPPPIVRGTSVNFVKVEKIETGKDIGLPTAKAVIASATIAGVDVRAAVTGADKFYALRLDTSGGGRFSKAPVLRMKTVRNDARMYMAKIGPARIAFKKDGRSIPVNVIGRYFEIKGKSGIYLYFTAAVEGACRFGDTTRKVRIIDGSGDMTFGAARARENAPAQSVRVQVAEENGRFVLKSSRTAPGSEMKQPVQVGGKWYVLSVAGMKVSAKALTCPMGKIAGDGKKWQLALTGKKYKIWVSGGTVPVDVPVDTYRLSRCNFFADGPKQAARVSSAPEKPLNVVAGKTISVPTNLPIKATVLAVVKEGNVTFSLKQTDAAGCRIVGILNRAGLRPTAPSIEIVDRGGKVVHTVKLEYG